jgi:hypothetical protein
VEILVGTVILESSLRFIKRLKMEKPDNLATPILGIGQKKMEPYIKYISAHPSLLWHDSQ